jgi:hypothetical protein
MQLGRLAMHRGDLPTAERLLTHAQQDAVAAGRGDSALEAAIHLSRCHLLRGDPGQALDTLRSAQRASRGDAAVYAVQAAEVEVMILGHVELYDQAEAVAATGIADARRQGLVYELAMLLLAAADVATRAGQDAGDSRDEALELLEGLGCEVPAAYRAQRGSPAPK